MTILQLVSIGVAGWCATDLLIVWLLWRRETPTMRRERRLRELAPLSGLITDIRSGTAADHWCSKCQRHHDSFGCPSNQTTTQPGPTDIRSHEALSQFEEANPRTVGPISRTNPPLPNRGLGYRSDTPTHGLMTAHNGVISSARTRGPSAKSSA